MEKKDSYGSTVKTGVNWTPLWMSFEQHFIINKYKYLYYAFINVLTVDKKLPIV